MKVVLSNTVLVALRESKAQQGTTSLQNKLVLEYLEEHGLLLDTDARLDQIACLHSCPSRLRRRVGHGCCLLSAFGMKMGMLEASARVVWCWETVDASHGSNKQGVVGKNGWRLVNITHPPRVGVLEMNPR